MIVKLEERNGTVYFSLNGKIYHTNTELFNDVIKYIDNTNEILVDKLLVPLEETAKPKAEVKQKEEKLYLIFNPDHTYYLTTTKYYNENRDVLRVEYRPLRQIISLFETGIDCIVSFKTKSKENRIYQGKFIAKHGDYVLFETEEGMKSINPQTIDMMYEPINKIVYELEF